MTIRKLIQRSNAFIVLVSLITFFLIVFVVVALFSRDLIQSLGDDEFIGPDIYEIQTILRGDLTDDWEDLAEQFAKYNYDLVVLSNNELQYITNDDLDELKHQLKDRANYTEPYDIFHRDSWTVIRKPFTYNGQDYIVLAIYGYDEDQMRELNIETVQVFVFNFLLLGVLVILALMFVSYVFTNNMVKRIMNPVDLLMAGVKRIEKYDYSKDIEYEGEEEFEKLCTTFNDMQHALLEEMKKNTAYDKARTDMISGISHDLRTPLTSIKGFLKGMKDGVANTPEKQSNYIDICYNKADEMDSLLQQLYFYSKLETKVMPFQFECVDLGGVLQHMVESKRSMITDSTQIIYEKPNKQMMCDLDPNQFHRVFTNIVENSMKYGEVEDLIIHIHLREYEDGIRISISDNGQGIEENKIKYVFNQFFRGDESRNSAVDGSGLGLYLTQQIIQKHGGRIDAYNDNGFVVNIDLPRHKEVNVE